MKRMLIWIWLCLCGALVHAQDYKGYLEQAYEHLKSGNRESARKAYMMYNTMTGSRDVSFEEMLDVRRRRLPNPYYTETVKELNMKLVYVEGGDFFMGGTEEQGAEADDDETPVRQVNLNSFYIGECEVTQAQWTKIMGTTIEQQQAKKHWPWIGVGASYPMYFVSWEEAQEFCRALSRLTGRTYRLPTEAEWEYAARGGKRSEGTKYSGSNDIDAVAWYSGNSNWLFHPVKSKQPNALGLYDMSGNAAEWCADWYDYIYDAGEVKNPTGPASGRYRVARGGSSDNSAVFCRVSRRSFFSPDSRVDCVGFRVVLEP